MFGKKRVEEPEITVQPQAKPTVPERPVYTPARVTTIAPDVTMVGDFITSDTLEIKGTIKGDVLSETKIHVAESGFLNGDAKATDILVDGEVDGTIIISNIAEISDTGSLKGTLETKTLVTNPQSHFDGRLTMIPERMKRKPEPVSEEDSSVIEY